MGEEEEGVVKEKEEVELFLFPINEYGAWFV